MSPRTTGILALVALALGLFVWLYEIEGEAERAAARDAQKEIFRGLDPEDVDAIALTTLDGAEARFERREGRWWLVSPVPARADATALDAMASALASLPREGSVAGTRDPADFGLGREPGAAQRLVRFEVGGEERGLRIGRTTPVGGHRYVAPLAADDIAYVASYRVNAFERNLADLRDRSLFDFVPEDIERLAITRPQTGFEIVLARDDAGAWQIESPISGPADPEVLREIVSNLAHLRARDFVDVSDSLDPAVRDETAVELVWRLAGDEAMKRARIAGATGAGRLFVHPDGTLYVVAEERLEDFPDELSAYRFKRLADFDLAAARRLELHFVEPAQDRSAALDVVAELGDAGWTSPGRPLDRDRTTRLVRELSNLSADAIVADEMGEAERASLGLAPPRARLRVEGGVDRAGPIEALADLRFGRFDPDRGLFVQRADLDTIFLLEPATAEALPYSAERFRAEFEVAERGLEDGLPEADPEAFDLEGIDEAESP